MVTANAYYVSGLVCNYFQIQFVYLIKECVCAKSLQTCPSLCNPMDYSPPGSSFYGILQTRILEWVAMPSSRGSSPPKD